MMKSFEKKLMVVVKDTIAQRLDKTLAKLIPQEFCVSRSRVKELMNKGAVTNALGVKLRDPATKSFYGQRINIILPIVKELEILPEDIGLNIIYEDTDLLVLDKPAGMVVHPAPGSTSGTLVNALLFHCGSSLSGIGGVKRPGIVHRIDKDTSGLLVVAKTDRAHHGLSKQFFKHTIHRKYLAFAFGKPSNSDERLKRMHSVDFITGNSIKIFGKIARHKTNRKRMAVYKDLGRHAVTHITVKRGFGPKNSQIASLIECTLETGRTHQIRAHLNYIGHDIIGDPIYKSQKRSKLAFSADAKEIIENLNRQALHASFLGFKHPGSGKWLDFISEIPSDIKALADVLGKV